MAAKATQMEQLKQIFRLKQEGFSISAIMRYTGISRPTIRKYLKRISNVSEDHQAPEISDAALAQTVYNNDTTELKAERYAVLLQHFIYAEAELGKTGVTRQLLWLEYKEQHSDGYN